MKSYGGTQLTAHSGPERGYTILEVVFVILVVGVVMAIAAPSTQTALQNYHLNQAVKDVSGAIQSTRYLAIMKGYTYNIAFTQSSKSYQVGAKIPPSTTFSNSGSPVVWGVTSDVTLGTSTTLQFSPGGIITATTGSLTFTLSNAIKTETLTVSSVGDVTVSP